MNTIQWLVGSVAGIVGVFIFFIALRKVYRKGTADALKDVSLVAAQKALEDLNKRRKNEILIGVKYDELEAALPDQWPDTGVIELQRLEENRLLSGQNSPSPVSPGSGVGPKPLVKRPYRKAKPRKIR